jgi:heat-inducible transcriptional repressor
MLEFPVEEKLSERELWVLEEVVRNFISSATPTSSRFLARRHQFELSPATIRNVMGDLEDRGYITHMHTSAGRVPTDKGYRYYVDRLMQCVNLPLEIRHNIEQAVCQVEPSDLHMVMEATSHVLSRVTDLFGVVLSPKIGQGIFRHVHIHAIMNRRYLVTVTIDAGFVKTVVAELETDIDERRLESACGALNDRYYGKTLREIIDAGDGVFADMEEYELGIIRLFIPSLKRVIDESSRVEIVSEGKSNILLKPEFFAKDQAGVIIEILQEERMLMHLIDTAGANDGRVIVAIGTEMADEQLCSFSVVKARYRIGNMEGSLGVVGPRRMPYPFLVSAVDYTAKLLSSRFDTSEHHSSEVPL